MGPRDAGIGERLNLPRIAVEDGRNRRIPNHYHGLKASSRLWFRMQKRTMATFPRRATSKEKHARQHLEQDAAQTTESAYHKIATKQIFAKSLVNALSVSQAKTSNSHFMS